MKHKSTEKLFKLAYTDMQTGVYNRNAFEERMKKFHKPSANLRGITFVAVDVDNLKQVNDTYGYFMGDKLLKTVAEALHITIGEKAEIYRIKGNRFVCIAEGDIRGYISEFRDMIGFHSDEIDVSIGYAAYEDSTKGGIDELMQKCDKMLMADRKRNL